MSTSSYYYAVAKGRVPGVFTGWDECSQQVHGFAGAIYKKFKTLLEAQDFIRSKNAGASTNLHPQQQACMLPPANGQGSSSSAAGSQAGGQAAMRSAQVKRPLHASYEQLPEEQQQAQRRMRPTLPPHRIPTDPDPQVDTRALVAFCDGSALNNGAANCRSGWACVFPHNPEWDRAEPLEGAGTNNRAEYSAALEAIRRSNRQNPDQSQPLFIFSDSNLLIKSMTQWVEAWRRNRWVKADGKEVKNRDLLEQLVAEQGARRVIWKHVQAHTGGQDWESRWNAKVDALARETAMRGRQG